MGTASQESGNGLGRGPFQGILKGIIETRAKARRQLLSELRGNTESIPFLGAGLGVAEQVSRRCEEMERSFVQQVADKAHMDAKASANPSQPAQPASGRQPSAEQGETTPPALRVSIPQGTESAIIPLQLRNPRGSVDTVVLSAIAAPQNGVAQLPVESIHFEPRMLTIEPNQEACANLKLRITPALQLEKEYWTKIVIAGTDTRQIPLAVRIVRASATEHGNAAR